MTAKTVRLNPDTLQKLSHVFSECLRDDPNATVLLFGSRTDPESKGGDLDFIVVSRWAAKHAYAFKKKLRMAIREQVGDQRVDILVIPDRQQENLSPFLRLVLMDSVPIWP